MIPRPVFSTFLCAGLLLGTTSAHSHIVSALSSPGDNPIKLSIEQGKFQEGREAVRNGQYEKAEKAFLEANRINPKAVEPVLALAMLARTQGKTEQALDAFNRAALLAPSSALPNALRGQLLERQNRFDEAESAYRNALRAESEHLDTINNLAALLAGQKLKLTEAQTLAERAVKANPAQPNYIDTLGMVQQARGDTVAARKSFEKALSLDPKNPNFRKRFEAIQPSSTVLQTASAVPAAVPTTIVAAPAQKPAPVTPTTATPQTNPEKAVGPALEAWRKAWETKDASRYLAFYAKDFSPADKRSRTAWETERRAKLEKKGEIQIQVQNPAFSLAGNTILVSFEQRYKSSNYSDSARKQIEWIQEAGEWRIRREAQH